MINYFRKKFPLKKTRNLNYNNAKHFLSKEKFTGKLYNTTEVRIHFLSNFFQIGHCKLN